MARICKKCGKVMHQPDMSIKSCPKCRRKHKSKYKSQSANRVLMCHICLKKYKLLKKKEPHRSYILCPKCHIEKSKLINIRFGQTKYQAFRNLISDSKEYKEWRQKILIRDDFTCQKCSQRGGKLYAHHKNKSFSQLLQEVEENLPLFPLYDGVMAYTPFWDILNGQTLCLKCHRTTFKGQKKNKIKAFVTV